MEDPVLLPTSSVIVDKSTIRAHLLGDTRDPFNRAPLTMDMVQPGKKLTSFLDCFSFFPLLTLSPISLATELKAKIAEWKAEQKSKKNSSVSAMDTSPWNPHI